MKAKQGIQRQIVLKGAKDCNLPENILTIL